MKLRELAMKDIAQRVFDTREITQFIRSHHYSMSWGMHNIKLYKDQAIVFNVKWFKHTGLVFVSLDWNDTFTITLTERVWNLIKKQIKGVYIDNLIDVLDAYIEKGCSDEEYKEKVEKTQFNY